MKDVIINALKVEVLLILAQAIYRLHPECVLKDLYFYILMKFEYLLSCCKEDVFELITEVEGLGKNTKELWLLKADA